MAERQEKGRWVHRWAVTQAGSRGAVSLGIGEAVVSHPTTARLRTRSGEATATLHASRAKGL